MDFEPRTKEEYIELLLRDVEDLKISFLNFLNNRVDSKRVLSQIELIKNNIKELGK